MRCGDQVCLSRGARVRSAIRRRTGALGVVDAGSVDCGCWLIRKPDDNHKRALSARGAAAQRFGWRIRGGGTARPSPSNLTRRARRRPAHFHQAIKNRPKAVSLFSGGSGVSHKCLIDAPHTAQLLLCTYKYTY